MTDSFSESSTPIVEVQGLTRRFDDKVALNDLSLTVHRGGVFGLIGATELEKRP